MGLENGDWKFGLMGREKQLGLGLEAPGEPELDLTLPVEKPFGGFPSDSENPAREMVTEAK